MCPFTFPHYNKRKHIFLPFPPINTTIAYKKCQNTWYIVIPFKRNRNSITSLMVNLINIPSHEKCDKFLFTNNSIE